MTETGYPPTERTLTLTGEEGRFDVVVTRDPDGRVGSTSDIEPAGGLFARLDLTTADRLVAATWAVVHDGREPWQEHVGDVLLFVEAQRAVLSLDRRPGMRRGLLRRRRSEPAGVTSTSLAFALEGYREFLAAWTPGEHHDVTLRVDGVPETHRMARDARGTVQIVPHGWWSATSLFLADLQDEDIIDFFLEQLREVTAGRTESRTGTNATSLVIRPESCDLSLSTGNAVELDTLELRDELDRLRAFVADRSGTRSGR